jgi:hypothetical protein
MSKGRGVPIIFAAPRASDPSQVVDAKFFRRNPGKREYTRRYIKGETVEPMHPDTWLHVAIIRGERVRGFAPPSIDERRN